MAAESFVKISAMLDLRFVLFLLTVFGATNSQLILFNDTDVIEAFGPLSAGCAQALMANITCPTQLLDLAGTFNFSYSDTTLTPLVCDPSCTTSLKDYHDNIAISCENDPQPWPGVPATVPGDLIWTYTNRTCLKDSTTGQYCTDEILDRSSTLASTAEIDDFPTEFLCSNCFLAMFQYVQGTSFSNYDEDMATNWTSIQQICGVSYPTEVQQPAANANLSQIDLDYSNTDALPPASCLSGNTYSVVSGDTCTSISAANNVATGSLIVINNLLADCSGLLAGDSICLPQTCTTYTVQPNDTCWSIGGVVDAGFSLILSWNPALNSDCSNLIAGQTVCISPPGGTYTPTLIPGATVTKVSPYASVTVAPPGPTPFGTTANCGKYYQVNSGDNCQQISLNQTITVDLFEAINPSINAGCTNLSPGLFYCVLPTQSWNVTSAGSCIPQITSAPPAPTTAGASAACYQWHTIVSGDYCALLEQEYGITFEQLQSWNPSLDSNCDNLILGDAYCVNATPQSSQCTSSTPSTTSSAPVTTPTPHQPNMVSGCKTFYAAQSGDYCYLIATNYGISTDTFISWNPDVQPDCSALWVGEYYCVGM